MENEDFIRKSVGAIVPGEDVSALSVSELEIRIIVLKDEIKRLEGAIKGKYESKNAADSVFKL